MEVCGDGAPVGIVSGLIYTEEDNRAVPGVEVQVSGQAADAAMTPQNGDYNFGLCQQVVITPLRHSLILITKMGYLLTISLVHQSSISWALEALELSVQNDRSGREQF